MRTDPRDIGSLVCIRVDLEKWATLTGPLLQGTFGTVEEIVTTRHVGGVLVSAPPRFLVRLDKPIEPVPGWPSAAFWFDPDEIEHVCSREMNGACHHCGERVTE